jgi:hypothetical protein
MKDDRDDALAALLDRAVGSVQRPSVERLPEVVRRGSRRRAVRVTTIVTALTVFVGAIAWVGLTFPRNRVVVPGEPAEPEPATTTLYNDEGDFRVTVPDGWVVADENLTPWLSSPTEILSLGTFPLRVSEHPEDGLRIWDAPVAPAALADMTADDVFLSLQEREGGLDRGDLPRPESFRSDACDPEIGCGTGDVPFQAWWTAFEDGGRGFYLTVAIGDDVSPSMRDAIWDVADSLVFVPA